MSFATRRGNHFTRDEGPRERESDRLDDMEETPARPATAANPYQYEKDDALETFARGVIDEAIAKSTTSPRQFGFFSSAAAKQIAQYVLEHFTRQKSDA